MSKMETIEDFYQHKLNWMPENPGREMGHFNVFRLEDFVGQFAKVIPYNRKDFFKISLIIGKNQVHYADKTIGIDKQALFFANPQIPYNWEYCQEEQAGFFCIFTETFFTQFGNLKDYPVFKSGGTPVFFLTDQELEPVKEIYLKMFAEINSDYCYKYDVIRTLVFELVHLAMKMEPATDLFPHQNAATRISALFTELLERQFPLSLPYSELLFAHPLTLPANWQYISTT